MKKSLLILGLTSILCSNAFAADARSVIEKARQVESLVSNRAYNLDQRELNRVMIQLTQIESMLTGMPIPAPNPVPVPVPVPGRRADHFVRMSDNELFAVAQRSIGSCLITSAPGGASRYYLKISGRSFQVISELTEWGGSDDLRTIARALRTMLNDGICTNEYLPVHQMSVGGVFALGTQGYGRCRIDYAQPGSGSANKYYVKINEVSAQYTQELSQWGGTDDVSVASRAMRMLVSTSACY